MTKKMNENVGTMEHDGLVYDGKFPVDVMTIKLKSGQGVLKRGSIICRVTVQDGDDSTVILGTTASSGETLNASYILSDDVDTTETTGSLLVATAYRTGHFARQKLITKNNTNITENTVNELRSGGIYISSLAI